MYLVSLILLLAQLLLHSDLPVFNPLPDQGFQGGDVYHLNTPKYTYQHSNSSQFLIERPTGNGTKRLQQASLTNLGGWIFVENPKHGNLCCDGFTGASWGPQQDVCVGVVKSVKNLSLDRVEVSEFVQALKLMVAQSRHWQWLQV